MTAAMLAIGSGVLGCGGGSSPGVPAVEGDPGPSTPPVSQAQAKARIVLSIDPTRGPVRQFKPTAKPVRVSPYVYGINSFGVWQKTTHWGLARAGGDATTAWNWTNNYSNSASDYCFWQGQDDGGSALAGNLTAGSGLTIAAAQAAGIAYLVTAPIVDHVSAAYGNNTGINNLCPGSVSCSSGSFNGYAVNSGNLPFASTGSSPAFVTNGPSKPGGAFCTCQPGGSCASGCFVDAAGPVYQDEFANFLRVTYGSGGAPIFFSLDNEPNYWPGTHPEIWPHSGTPGCGTSGTVTFDDLVARNTTYATAIKKAWPAAKIFGPVVAQDGIVYGGDYSDPHLPTPFSDYYLGKMAAASAAAGQPLLDAFDVHYYTSNGSAAQCLQVPRMFWDPAFTAFSAATTDGIDFGWSGLNGYFDTALYPRQMVPRLLGKIATAYAGNATAAPGLSFSEYNAGCETVIEGGVAEADLLGIFGREGVMAATAWPLQAITGSGGALTNYLVAAYDLYRNYDGAGAEVGDTAVYASTPDVTDTSVYAFTHPGQPLRIDVVALNKESVSVPVTLSIANAPALKSAAVYELTSARVGVVARTGPAPVVTCASGTCTVKAMLPALSASTFALK